MTITVSELRKRLGYYLKQSSNEPIYITKRNKTIAVLMDPKDHALDELKDFHNKYGFPVCDDSYDDLLLKAILEH